MISIKDYGGLEPYLDGTRGLHGGIGYKKFVIMVDDNVLEAEIKRKMKLKSREPISRWKRILKEEREAANVTAPTE